MYQNNLIVPILHILRTQQGSLSEYELIRQIESDGVLLNVDADNYQLALFKKHFMIMNALYALQVELLTEGVYLTISALHIAITPGGGETTGSNLQDHADVNLREYYLDWNNYDATGEDEVQRLLAGFWQKYAAVDKRQVALGVLGIEGEVEWEQIRNGYRRMAMQHHPDKGGDEKKFIEIREAYEILRCCYERI